MADKKRLLRAWASANYVIEVEGLLEKSLSARFAGMRITQVKRDDGSYYTRLTGLLMDQTELAGVLIGLFEFHLPILYIKFIDSTSNMKESA